MKLTRRSFLRSGAGLGVAISLGTERANAIAANDARMQLIRHATLVIHYGGKVLMVDPMLGGPGAMPAIDRSPNPRPNPLVPLPVAADKVLTGVDAVLVTHTHPDHWDAAAINLVAKNATVFVQPHDSTKFAELGFTSARPIDESIVWNGIRISRTGGQHGRGDVGQRMAPVSGYVFNSPGWPTVYVAGDTVWCPEVDEAIQIHKPDVIIVNAGAAQFLEGGPITMDVDDVLHVCEATPRAKVIAVHMEAINHCVLTRTALREALNKSPLKPPVLIPQDGELLQLS